MTNLVHLRTWCEARQARRRVFDDGLIKRLATLNAAARSLRSMGYRLLDQRVQMGDGGTPVIVIGPGRERASNPLRRATTATTTYRQDNETYACVDYMGVKVIWKAQ